MVIGRLGVELEPRVLVGILVPGLLLLIWIWCWWLPRGKSVLFVHSDSPVWQDYLAEHVLNQLDGRAVVLNWSERQRWRAEHPVEAYLFTAFAGDREFNPIAIFVPADGWRHVQVVRFWRAFRDYKHGKDAALGRAEQQLEKILARSSD